MIALLRAVVSLPLALVAAVVAFVSATLFERLGATRVRREWLRHLARLPARWIGDAVLLGRVLVARLGGKKNEGSFRWVSLGVHGSDAESAARRALARVGLSFAPNTYVIDVDREGGRLLVHQLARPVPPGASWEELL